ncbi:beta-glucuronidase [Pelobium manganitolerans]|uniref:beta-galactosidase n=1 Tax=Pelobium manganitolerans TaxID=1842495 RepID=A0A419S261_9SPHI|nr:sugar-binding domain-containing protein [Pelobium manganitolerans]RKD12816.1 beta-glucuronidase [Pelobium manganitolerans]
MRLKKHLVFLCLFSIFNCVFKAFADEPQRIPLAGTWRFKMDAADRGINEKWFAKTLDEQVKLPGSMAENNKGENITLKTQWTGSIYDSSFFFNPRLEKYRKEGNIKIPFWLTPNKHYVGAAWYQKDVEIPAGWAKKHLILFLEQPHTETIVWIDDQQVGMQNSMVAPHQYNISKLLSPGKHTITIRVDNRIKEINVGPDSHSLTDHTQGNWNGINGRMEIIADNPLYVEDLQVYPNLKEATAQLKIVLNNEIGKAQKGEIHISAQSFNSSKKHQVRPIIIKFNSKGASDSLVADLPMGDFLTWDEFSPALYRLTAALMVKGKKVSEKQVTFGMRSFKADGHYFTINGRKTFLRGTVDNAVFPLTGYPATDLDSWLRIMRKCKAYGLNHVRYHSWCPPEAAFEAADLVGIYLQPEGPSWANHGSSLGYGAPIDQFIYDETTRMAKQYGNYASFCMMAYGNEPRGRQVEYLTEFNNYWKAKDSRRLYTGASVGGSWPVIPNNEFMVRAGARGLDWNRQPESYSTYADKIRQFAVPFVAHEMGQYCVFPNFDEIKKYTGVYRAKNFELFQEDLADHHMADQAHLFMMASGKLQALCYKYEIEKALRTPNYSGFQLLSLNDYPGQGTALVGVLDAFWDDKGYIDSTAFTRFCDDVVPLASLKKFTFNNSETFEAEIQVANYSQNPFDKATVICYLKDELGKTLFTYTYKSKLAIGLNTLGNISYSLSAISKAAKLNLEVEIAGTKYSNNWNVWVYPAKLPQLQTDVYYTTALDAKAKAVLAKGGKVFLNAAGQVVKGKEVVQTFLPVFWNTSWFKMRPPHTLGFLVNPKHPAFADFPTAYHSELQWWEIVNKQQVMVLEDFPADFRPIIQPIDTWFMNRRLASVFEAKVGGGKLVVSSSDLSPQKADGTPAKQLYYSIVKYMASADFNPKNDIKIELVEDIFKTPTKQQFDTFTKSSPDELRPKSSLQNKN